MLAPSLNFPRPSVNDGTDHVRPATLRGLGPDQTLVLVNGKRRHASALVNANNTVGRGSSGVDLNAIPAAAIQNIEILRDGAAAQYGSDAIAGVINIVLKSGVQPLALHGVDRFAARITGLGATRSERGDVYKGIPILGPSRWVDSWGAPRYEFGNTNTLYFFPGESSPWRNSGNHRGPLKSRNCRSPPTQSPRNCYNWRKLFS